MSNHRGTHPPLPPDEPLDGLILQGAPPSSGRPSWLGLVLAVVIALAAGAALGYGVANPPTPAPSARTGPPSSPSPSPAPTAFAASPCDLLAAVPYAKPPTFATSTIATNPSAVPGMRSCVVLDPATMHRFAQVMLRQLPTSRADFTVVADEVFQGDDVSPSSFGTTPGLLIPCSHFWPTCHPAAAFVQAPYFVIVALEPGVGDVSLVRSLATGLLGMGFAGAPARTVSDGEGNPRDPDLHHAHPARGRCQLEGVVLAAAAGGRRARERRVHAALVGRLRGGRPPAHGLGGQTNPGLVLARRRAVATTGCERVRGLHVHRRDGVASRHVGRPLRAGGHERLRAGRGLLEHPRADPGLDLDEWHRLDRPARAGPGTARQRRARRTWLPDPRGSWRWLPVQRTSPTPRRRPSRLMASAGTRSPTAPSRPASSSPMWPGPRPATWRSAPTRPTPTTMTPRPCGQPMGSTGRPPRCRLPGEGHRAGCHEAELRRPGGRRRRQWVHRHRRRWRSSRRSAVVAVR